MTWQRNRIPERAIAMRLADELIERLHLEATRTGRTMRSIVTDALNAALPAEIKLVATPPKSCRAASGNS